ncbi:M48 family metalloprotease [Actinokineospora sp. 24-640]
MVAFVRGLVAAALLAGFYLMVLALVLFYAALVLVVLVSGQAAFQPMVLLALVGLGVVVLVVVRSLARVSDLTPEPGGDPVPRTAHLWALVGELAERVGTRPPDVLLVTDDANAAVMERVRLLGLVGGTRTLAVGRPLLACLTVGELRAVLCHELGHYARGHTRLTALAYRGSVALRGARAAIAEAALGDAVTRMYAGLPFRLFSAYAWVYDRATLGPRRKQELAADAAAARVAGKEVTADALLASARTAAAWSDFTARFLDRAPTPPDDPVAAFSAMLADPDYRDRLAAAEFDGPEPTWRDSHPSLRTRLARLARLPETPEDPDRRPATDLVDAPSPRRGGVPWREWVAAAAARRAEELAAPLLAALGPEPSPAQVLDLLESGDRDRVTTRVAVTALVGQAMVRAGAAAWSAPWIDPPRLIAGDDGPERLAAALDQPSEVPRLRLALAASNVDINTPIPLPAREHRRASLFPEAPVGAGALKPVLWFVGVLAVVAVFIAVGQEDDDPVLPGSPVFPTRTYLPTYPTAPPYPTYQPPIFSVPRSFLLPTPGITLAPLPTRPG